MNVRSPRAVNNTWTVIGCQQVRQINGKNTYDVITQNSTIIGSPAKE